MRTAVAVVAVLATACQGSSPGRSPAAGGAATSAVAPAAPAAGGPIADADAAVDRFIAAWAAEVRPTMSGHEDPLIGMIDETMREPDARRRYSARLEPCRDGHRMIADLIASSGHDFVLHGALAAAAAHDRCWTVQYTCCMKGDAGAQLDPSTGALLVVWRIPEG